MCGCNGGATPRMNSREATVDMTVDPTVATAQAALAAAAASSVLVEVVRNGVPTGRRFTSLLRAQMMAERLGGEVRPVDPAYA